MQVAGFALIVLVISALYLTGFGAIALAKPATAIQFLSAFAQSVRANLIEAIARMIVGFAMIRAGPSLVGTTAWTVAGLFLVVTAILMIVFPKVHRQLAAQSVHWVKPYVRLVGIASIGLGLGLAALLAA